jgi:hypothetical protein
VLPVGLAQSLSLRLGSPELSALQPAVLIAGMAGATITLAWEIWDATAGWRPGGSEQPATVAVERLPDEGPFSGVAVSLPFSDKAGQAVLSARRQITRSDGTVITIRSNPLLVTLYGGSG